MKKLLFITTGGTIACGIGGNGLIPEKDGHTLLLGAKLPCPADILDLYSIDSTDVTPNHWRRLHDTIVEKLPHYDGIVILHGTDTMAYTGAVLDLTIETEKPVILTGSMLSADERGSDAKDNIQFAAMVAYFGRYSGCWLAFGNSVIRGSDIAKVSSKEKASFRAYSHFLPDKKYAFPVNNSNFPQVIKLTPFSRSEEIDRISAPCAVIETYGAGGLPEGEIAKAVERVATRIPVAITTPCLGGTSLERYEVGRRALSAGVIDSKGMSTECAAVWLWLSCR